MKVLLIAPPKDAYMGIAQYPPVGLGYLATAARQKGHGVRIIDCVKEGLSPAGFRELIAQDDSVLYGFNLWSLALKETKESIAVIRQLRPQAKIILGGPHPSALPKETLEYFPQADFAFCGEGEIGFPLFLDALAQGRQDFAGVPGLVWRREGEIKANDPAWEEDLDKLGYPSWDLLNPRAYFKRGTLIGRDTAVLTCTRGCPYQCTFCSAWITAGRKIRLRSISHILCEIEYLNRNFGIRVFDIPDENFTFDREHVIEFCQAVMPYRGRFEFFLPNGIRLDSLDLELLRMMRQAGFRREVAVGIESCSQRVLKLMKKNLSLSVVREKVALLNKAGFRPIGYFILGFPGETRQDMQKTLALAMELKLCAAAFTPFAPMPGTEATNALLENGELPRNFDFSAVTTDKVAYSPPGISKEELDALRKKAILKFNLRPLPLFYYLKNFDSFKFAAAKVTNLFFKKKQVQ